MLPANTTKPPSNANRAQPRGGGDYLPVRATLPLQPRPGVGKRSRMQQS